MLQTAGKLSHVLTSTSTPGENLGWGGELMIAQFLVRHHFDTQSMQPLAEVATPTKRLGLLLDARCDHSVDLIRRIMTSSRLVKLLWGADSDLVSLCHQWCLTCALAKFSSIEARNVIDLQLAYSSVGRRMGMSRALELYVRQSRSLLSSSDLPKTFYMPLSRNKRVLQFPLAKHIALYAVDDLHRIEAILSEARPPGGTYLSAKAETEQIQAKIATWDVDWLHLESRYFSRKYGWIQTAKAVQIARAIRHMELSMGNPPMSTKSIIDGCTAQVRPVLRRNGVTIPSDLSFA